MLLCSAAWASSVAAETPKCAKGPQSKCRGLLIPDRKIVERNLTRADFRGSWLVGARWHELTLFKARMTGVNLTRARITDTRMTSLNPSLHRGSRMRLTNARLARVRLGGNLRGLSLKGARVVAGDLSGANLARADLRGARLRGARLRDANLTGARLAGADLSGADLRGANLTGANLDHARLRRTKLAGARLVGTNLRRAHLQGADLQNALILDADLTLAKLVGAKLGFYGAPTEQLGPAWAAAAHRFPRPLELAGRACLTKADVPSRASERGPSAPRPRLGAKIEAAHSRFRRRIGGVDARPSEPRFYIVANTLDSGCGGGQRQAKTALAAIAHSSARGEGALRARARQLLEGAAAPSEALREWVDLVVRRS